MCIKDSRPQWKRYAKLLYPSTIATGGSELSKDYWGWGQYSIVGFGEEEANDFPSTPVIAVTYHDVNYWNNSALAEALWDGSWTDSSGEKVPFNLQTSDGREIKVGVLLKCFTL